MIGEDPILWYQTIKVNIGSELRRQASYDPVIGPGGLVGDVTHVSPDSSEVSLITSPRLRGRGDDPESGRRLRV